MWLLHVIAISGGSDWQRAVSLWLLTATVGGGYAALSGEWHAADGLLLDLALALGGGVAGNLATRPLGNDPLAALYGLRVFWSGAGALVCLLLAHDALRLLPAGSLTARCAPLRLDGGFLFLALWLSGWPAEAGLIEATYGDGCPIKLLPAALHYQAGVRRLRTARTLPVARISAAVAEGDALVILLLASPRSPTQSASRQCFSRVRPAERAITLAEALTQLIERAREQPAG